jgi:fused signal recognition particle receptor
MLWWGKKKDDAKGPDKAPVAAPATTDPATTDPAVTDPSATDPAEQSPTPQPSSPLADPADQAAKPANKPGFWPFGKKKDESEKPTSEPGNTIDPASEIRPEPPAPAIEEQTSEDPQIADPALPAKAALSEPVASPIPEQAPETCPETGPETGTETAPHLSPELAQEPPATPVSETAGLPQEEMKKPGFFKRVADGLSRSSGKLAGDIGAVFTKRKLDAKAIEELEDLLVSADLGATLAARVTEALTRSRFDKEVSAHEVRSALAEEIARTLAPREKTIDFSDGPSPRIVLFVGVNGSGKTTTIGKIAAKLSAQGARLLLVAGDTFRAAAVEQLRVWADRAGTGFMSKPTGADAAGLAYEAIEKARAEGYDLVLIDTAGRLQNKAELMAELEKVVRVIGKVAPGAPHDVILVLDATVGQNALSQVDAFAKAAGVSGLVMTKLDGTAKGGVLVAIADKHAIPIHFVGIGEKAEDLQPFSAEAFARGLVGLER